MDSLLESLALLLTCSDSSFFSKVVKLSLEWETYLCNLFQPIFGKASLTEGIPKETKLVWLERNLRMTLCWYIFKNQIALLHSIKV